MSSLASPVNFLGDFSVPLGFMLRIPLTILNRLCFLAILGVSSCEVVSSPDASIAFLRFFFGVSFGDDFSGVTGSSSSVSAS